jgi:DNA-binding response OmpR family regulator
MRLLVVEDSEILRESLQTGLQDSGFVVDVAADGHEGLWALREGGYDLAILDGLLPGLHGFEVLAQARASGVETPVLLLTALDAVPDRVEGLGRGADDYLVKPFDFRELLARVQALLRRRHGLARRVVAVADLELDLAARTVRRAGEPVALKPRELALLELLMLKRGRVVSKAEIETALYDDAVELASNAVEAAISLLRKALDRPGEPSLIQTRRGEGYLLEG